MEKRFVLFLVLSGLIFFGWSVMVEKFFPEQKARKQPVQTVPSAPSDPLPSPSAVVAPAIQTAPTTQAQKPPAAPGAQIEARQIKVKTDLWTATLSNQGAVITDWTMTHSNGGKPIDAENGGVHLLSDKLTGEIGGPFRLLIPADKNLENELNTARYTVENAPGPELFVNRDEQKEIGFAYENNGIVARKKLIFKGPTADSGSGFDFDFQAEITRNGQPLDAYVVAGPNFGDQSVKKITVYQHAPQITYAVGNSVTRIAGAGLKEKPESPLPSPAVSWAAVDDNYFAFVLIPPQPVPAISLNTYRNENGTEHNYVSVALQLAQGRIHHVYAGPKDINTLQNVTANLGMDKQNTSLEDIVSYGWLNFIGGVIKPIARFMLWALREINQFTHNFGWSIVLLTVVLNLFFFPLRWYSSRTMKRAAAMQPQMKELQDEMRKLGKDDPRMLEIQKRQLELMKDGNPLMGCLPLLLQMPFFMAVFAVLTVSIEVRHAPFIGWIKDLSSPDHLYILPVVMVATMIIQAALTPTTGDPMQKRMSYFMPIIFGWFLTSAPAGLVLYWMVGNLVGIGQQYVINRLTPTPPPAAAQSQADKPGAAQPKGKKTKAALANS